MWKILKVRESSIEAVAEALRQNYKPYAVSTDMMGFITLWFRKEEEIIEGIYREIADEISSKPKSTKRRSRKATTPAKG